MLLLLMPTCFIPPLSLLLTTPDQIPIQPDSDLLSRRYGNNTICLVDSNCTSPAAMTLPGSSSQLLFRACSLFTGKRMAGQ